MKINHVLPTKLELSQFLKFWKEIEAYAPKKRTWIIIVSFVEVVPRLICLNSTLRESHMNYLRSKLFLKEEIRFLIVAYFQI